MVCGPTLSYVLYVYGYILTWLLYLQVVQCHKCDVLVYFSLKTARCDNLHLPSIPTDLGPDIKVLSFAQNNLKYLNIDQFKIYPALQEIYLVDNKIDTIAPDAFRGLRNLQILDLEGNQITSVPSAAFKHLRSVRILLMKNNPITYITENAFGNLPKVEEVNFENCFLSRVDAKAFHGLPKLTDINLVNNELTSFSSDMEVSLPPELQVFRLYRNPWNCDCRLRWLRQWIANTKVNWDFAQNTPACSAPEIIRGINWKHLKPERFACPTRILANSTTSLEVQARQNITIECIIFGDPTPKVVWLKGDKGIPYNKQNKYMLRTENDETPYQIKSTLTIWDARSVDLGDYKCVADNSAGRSEVTYKLWMSGSLLEPETGFVLGISQESILGIAVGGAVFILILVFCVVYGMRRRDHHQHAYKVRDYKKQNSRGNKNDKKVAENSEKCLPNATTELLSEKEIISDKKEKETKKHEREKEKEKEKEPIINRQTMSNDIHDRNKNKNKNVDFKMKLFAYHGGKPTENNVGEATENDPLCKDTNKPVCDEMREVTPDLLKNDHKMHNSKPHCKEENAYVVMNSTTPKVANHVGPPPPKEERQKPEPPKRNTSLPQNQVKSREQKSILKQPSLGDRPPEMTKHHNSMEDLLRQSSCGSRDSLSSPPQSSTKSSPARTPTSSNDSLVKNLKSSRQPHSHRVVNSQSGTMNKINSKKNSGSKDNLSDKYQTLPTKVRVGGDRGNIYGTLGPARPNPAKQHLPSRSGPVAVVGVGSTSYQPIPAKNSPLKAQGQQVLKNYQASPTRVAVPKMSGNPSRMDSNHCVPSDKVPTKDHVVVTKGGRTLIIPPPPAPPGGRSPGTRPPSEYKSGTLIPREHEGDSSSASQPKKPPRTYASMYDFPSDPTSGSEKSPEVEKMPAPGTKTEFGTAV